MPREWNVICKRCGKSFGYSDRSYRNSLQYGFSRPEYCEKCQIKEKDMRKGMGAPYFHVPQAKDDIEPGPLGFIERTEERVHVASEREGKFDKTRFGVTEDDIYQIAEWFRDPNHRVLVATGATGAGKTIAVPYWFLYPPEKVIADFGADYFTRDGQILLTEPRIVALKKAVKFLGELMGSSIGKGHDLGYSYSKEDKADWRNAIDFTTDGKLVNWIVAGKISQYGFIIVDEAHEGSENIKIILRLLNERMSLYPNLKVVILSATIDTEDFQKYFARQGAAIIEFAGKARYDSKGNEILPPVRHFATEDERLPYEQPGKLSKPLMRAINEKVKWLVKGIVSGEKEWGDVLIFLHSISEINKLVEKLRAWCDQDEKLSQIVEVYPLYRTEDDQEDLTVVADEAPKPGKIRVIVSTNIAEASVTIDSLVYEIETGVEIQPQFKAEIGANEYPMVLISKANATQRFGRVGRTKNGEVYTLYTEQQYNELFREQPLDVLERSNLEDVLLKVKAAGIPDVQTGWLGEPPKEEVKRSTQQLISSNLLTESGTLTPYDALVRVFSYPPRLIDTLMAADDIGCSVEMVTLLPVIKNGGMRRFLSWRSSWDAYTKRTANNRHRALMAGCRDDVEFVLKIYKAWSELPWLDKKQLRAVSETELNSLRKQWAQVHFVNLKVMSTIHEERNKRLEHLNINAKKESRGINLRQIERVRELLRSLLTEGEFTDAPERYRWISEVEPQQGTLVTCRLMADTVAEGEDLYSRLFVDQVYPVGYRFEATGEEGEGGLAPIKIGRNVTRMKTEAVHTTEELDEDELEEDFEDEPENKEEDKEDSKIALSDISIWHRNMKCSQAVYSAESLAGQKMVVEIAGYQFQQRSPPTVIAKVVPHTEPFEVFASGHRYGDEMAVEVLELLKFPHDNTAALVVRDMDTNLEVLIEPQDIAFERNAYPTTQIPMGTRLNLNVEHVDTELERVRLTNWEAVENAITNHFKSSEGDDETSVGTAKVVEVVKYPFW